MSVRGGDDVYKRLLEYGFARRLVLRREGEELTLVLTVASEASDVSVVVVFRGVSDLKFLGERTLLTECVLLVARDISADGWEDARFRVKDYEEEFVSFVCREIEGPSPE
jgi:hypothetical protein